MRCYTFDNAIGALKVFTNPAAPAIILKVPILFALISLDMTSTE
jgi:hypothetical protein